MEKFNDLIWPDDGPGPEWLRELEPDAPIPFAAADICHPITAAIEDTLECGHGYSWQEGVGFVHAGPVGSAALEARLRIDLAAYAATIEPGTDGLARIMQAIQEKQP